jgi:hypothetical protein
VGVSGIAETRSRGMHRARANVQARLRCFGSGTPNPKLPTRPRHPDRESAHVPGCSEPLYAAERRDLTRFQTESLKESEVIQNK